MRHLGFALPLAVLAAAYSPAPARACGCFTPPDPVTNVLQAGERILFTVANGQVIANIQIQYSGAAADFGWLLPLPSVPTLEVSSDEVFQALATRTAPDYRVIYRYATGCFAVPDSASWPQDLGAPGGGGGPSDPLVYQDSVGPYDFAVLKADSKTAMLDWLKANRYFVPAGTDAAVAGYIRPGAYFLALKLKTGQSTGDLQPVIVRYASDLPMIPITLTSVGATPDMNVWVWVLGSSRAIPRNYHHVVLNDAALGWSYGTPWNYQRQVSAAVAEAPGRHAFVTELAQPTATVKESIFPKARFGDLAVLRKTTDAGAFLLYLRSFDYTFSAALVTILQRYIKQPPDLRAPGRFDMGPAGPLASPANYYYNFDTWLRIAPGAFVGFDLSFDAVKLTDEIEVKIVKPVRDAAALLDAHPYLTRLYTTLSPADMNSDPVFSFNPGLPTVSNVHEAVMDITCPKGAYSSQLITEQGFAIPQAGLPKMPAALRIETLREQGAPEVVTDNLATILKALMQSAPVALDMGVAAPPDAGVDAAMLPDLMPQPACSVAPGAATAGIGWMLALVGVALAARGRRRRRG